MRDEWEKLGNFQSDFSKMILRLEEGNKKLRYGAHEAAVLTVFYDDKLKARRRIAPMFMVYARACEGREPLAWNQAILDVNQAMLNLVHIDFVRKAAPASANLVIRGDAAQLYELTAEGLDQLQRLRPSVGLRLKAWIRVMPPWLVTVATIAGGVSALWKVVDLIHRTLGP